MRQVWRLRQTRFLKDNQLIFELPLYIFALNREELHGNQTRASQGTSRMGPQTSSKITNIQRRGAVRRRFFSLEILLLGPQITTPFYLEQTTTPLQRAIASMLNFSEIGKA